MRDELIAYINDVLDGKPYTHPRNVTKLEGLLREAVAALSSPCACGEPIAQGFILSMKENWCDGELGFRHTPLYWFEASAAELAKEMRCDYQSVLVFPALPTEKTP